MALDWAQKAKMRATVTHPAVPNLSLSLAQQAFINMLQDLVR
jgi:hypothetical protein